MNALSPPQGHASRYDRPLRPALFGFAFMALFASGLGAWSAAAPLAGASTAQGKLEVSSNRKSVQHPYGGVVKRIFVHEGEHVQQGQVLMLLSDVEPQTKLDVLTRERDIALAEEGRLIGERDGAQAPLFSADLSRRAADHMVAQALENEKAVMAARTQQYRVAQEGLAKRVDELQAQMEGTKAEARGIAAQQAILADERSGSEKLFAQGYTPKTKMLALDRSKAELETNLASKKAEMARSDEALAAARLDIAKAQRDRVTEIAGSLSQAEAKLAQLAPQIVQADDVLRRTVVRAPYGGAVVGLDVFTEGGVIGAGAKLLDIVPSGTPLIAVVRLALNDLSDVAVGRRADIRLTGVRRNERPRIGGHVLTISADRVDDRKSSGQPYYEMRVDLVADDVVRSRIKLQPGMPVEVVVNGQSRTLVAYLAGPMIDEITHAFHER